MEQRALSWSSGHLSSESQLGLHLLVTSQVLALPVTPAPHHSGIIRTRRLLQEELDTQGQTSVHRKLSKAEAWDPIWGGSSSLVAVRLSFSLLICLRRGEGSILSSLLGCPPYPPNRPRSAPDALPSSRSSQSGLGPTANPSRPKRAGSVARVTACATGGPVPGTVVPECAQALKVCGREARCRSSFDYSKGVAPPGNPGARMLSSAHSGILAEGLPTQGPRFLLVQ